MKHLPLLLIFLIQTLNTNGQISEIDMAIQTGISIPLFDYAATTLPEGSFATTGFTVSTEAKFMLDEHWSGALLAGLQLNPVDVGRLGYEKVNADPFLEDLYIRSDPYKVVHLMVGPAYQFPLNNSFSFESQLNVGVFVAFTPYQLYKPEYFFTGPPFYEITSARDVSFAMGGAVRLIYQVTPCYQIALTNQFLHSKSSFKFNTSNSTRTDIRNISLYNASFSIILKLFTREKQDASKNHQYAPNNMEHVNSNRE